MLMLIKLSSWMLGINSGDSIWIESIWIEWIRVNWQQKSWLKCVVRSEMTNASFDY